MRLNLSYLPDDVIKHYNLTQKVTSDSYVYLEVQKGMYGLPQAGILAHKLLETRLNDEGYTQAKLTPRFWTHKWRPILFTLCVDNFGVKYVGAQHSKHLMGVLSMHYTILHDWTGAKYLGINLDWDYVGRKVHTSMLGYVAAAIARFNHPPPKRPQHQP